MPSSVLRTLCAKAHGPSAKFYIDSVECAHQGIRVGCTLASGSASKLPCRLFAGQRSFVLSNVNLRVASVFRHQQNAPLAAHQTLYRQLAIQSGDDAIVPSSERSTTSRSPLWMPVIMDSPCARKKKGADSLHTKWLCRSSRVSRKSSAGDGKPASTGERYRGNPLPA